jgi:hypothetical protein
MDKIFLFGGLVLALVCLVIASIFIMFSVMETITSFLSS